MHFITSRVTAMLVLVLAAVCTLRAADPVNKAVTTPAPQAPLNREARPQPIQKLRLLTIGNSFADNALAFLPAIVKAAGKELVLFRANLGGHSLEKHVNYLEAYEKNHDDPFGHAYKNRTHPVTGEKKNFSLKEALESEKWDIVTIQQYSAISFKAETYQPFANRLISYIKQNAPTAQVRLYETWAYRADHPFFKDGKLTQATMYEGVKAAYDKLSSETGLRIIPVGDAFHAMYALPEWQYVAPAGEAMPNVRASDSSLGGPAATPVAPSVSATNSPALPNPSSATNALPGTPRGTNSSQPVPTVSLETLIKNGLLQRGSLTMRDRKHANQYGMFLAGCVFYEFLYHDNVEQNTFVPNGISQEDAKLIRRIAHETVEKAWNAPVVPLK
ncbi:MAG: DUF4886 domain-containing protein [Candidatus Methylacidiphilales bacterium]|nr:DUF4886 domain-containing protein [Candidatus Methylacidiphilales bacterium]